MARVTIGEVWDRTTEFLGDNWGALLPVMVGTMVVPSIVSAWLTATAQGADQSFRIIVAVASIGLALVSLWGQLAIAARAIDPSVGRSASRMATARLLPAIGIYLLLFLIVAVALGVQIAVLAAVYGIDLSQFATAPVEAQRMTLPDGVGPGLVLVLIAESISILFLAVRIAPLTGVIVAERRGVGAIARAWRLTRGLMWKLVGVVLLYALVSWVASAATTLVFGSGFAFAFGRGTITALVATAVPVGIVSAIFTVLATVFGAKLYLATVSADVARAPASDIRA